EPRAQRPTRRAHPARRRPGERRQLPGRDARSGVSWKPAWFATGLRTKTANLWRGVEAQHVVATMRLVDNAAEQRVLEELLEASKPALPEAAAGRHYLLATPFRYRSPFASRFRKPHDAGIWYGAEE